MTGCGVTALIFVVLKMALRHPLKSYFVPLVLAWISDLLLLRVHTIVPYPWKPRKQQLRVIEGFQYRLMVMHSLKLYKSKNGKGSSFSSSSLGNAGLYGVPQGPLASALRLIPNTKDVH